MFTPQISQKGNAYIRVFEGVEEGFTVAVMESDEIKTYPEEDTVAPNQEEPLDEEHLQTSFDKETMLYLYDLLGGKMDIA